MTLLFPSTISSVSSSGASSWVKTPNKKLAVSAGALGGRIPRP
jgi:hypothetical protein